MAQGRNLLHPPTHTQLKKRRKKYTWKVVPVARSHLVERGGRSKSMERENKNCMRSKCRRRRSKKVQEEQ